MKAALFREVGKALAIETIPDPTPRPDEIVLKVGRCGICGSDIHHTEHAVSVPASGRVLGHEYAGEVVALGRDVTRFKIGDMVIAAPVAGCGTCASCLNGEPAWCVAREVKGGGYAEYALARANDSLRLPAAMSLSDGALVEPLAVGLHTLNQADLKPGDKVVIIGAGPIGLACAWWARKMGAGRVAITAKTNTRADIAYAMGADTFLDPEMPMGDAVKQAFGGQLADVVIECAGMPGLIEKSVEAMRPRGTIVVAGICWTPDSIQPRAMMGKEARIQFAAFFSIKEFQVTADALEAGNLEPRAMVTDTVSLTGMSPVFEALRNRTTQCKVLINPWD